MSIIIPANSAVGGGFSIDNSIMLQDSRLFKTPSSSGSQRKFTFSAWIKKSDFSSGVIFSSGEADGNPNFALYFASNHKLNLYSSQGMEYTTNAVFRDPSAWMNIVISVNTAISNASNRQLIWVNGVQQTSFSTSNSIAQNTDLSINTSAYRMAVGTGVDNQDYFGGYVAEVVFLDDQALGHLSFGEFDSDSGIWKPIAITGSAATPGTNGFYLNFQDSGNLGNDEFGGTDLSVSDIVATDQSTDTCTNNFATFNPLFTPNPSNVSTFSEGNLKVVTNSTSQNSDGLSTIGVSSGKWYGEFKLIAQATGESLCGIKNNIENPTTNGLHGTGGFSVASNGDSFNNGSSQGVNNFSASYTNNDIIGIALDLDNNRVYFSKNGSYTDGSGNFDESSPTGYFSLTSGQTYFMGVGDKSTSQSSTWLANYGSPSFAISSGNADGNGYGNFEYAVPSGYLSLCTKNLSEALS